MVVREFGPIVLISCPREMTLATIGELSAGFERVFRRGERFMVITDMTGVTKIPDASWRRELSTWLNDPAFERQQRTYGLGAATIMRSAPLRAAMTALTWVWRPPLPQHYSPTLQDALDWAALILGKAGLQSDAPIASLRASVLGTETRAG